MRIRRNANRIKLNPSRMRALSLRVIDRLTYNEIGEKMEVSGSQAHYLVHSALEIIYLARDGEMRLCK